MGIMFLARFIRLPDSKSAPRAICAFIILSASSISVGMKRSAIVIIMASSCAGKWILLSGISSRSSPSVSAIGVVVSVIRLVPTSSSTSLSVIYTLCFMASSVMLIIQNAITVLPVRTIKRFTMNMNTSKNLIGFNERKT